VTDAELDNLNERLRRAARESAAAATQLAGSELAPLLVPKLSRVARVRSHDEALDLWQETMLGFLQAIERDGPPDDPIALINTIARRRAIDRLRRQSASRESPSLGPFLDELPDPGSDEPPVEQWSPASRARLRRVLKQMDRETRLVLSLRFLLGWTLKEIADALDMPLSTVDARAFRGLRELKNRLNSERGE